MLSDSVAHMTEGNSLNHARTTMLLKLAAVLGKYSPEIYLKTIHWTLDHLEIRALVKAGARALTINQLKANGLSLALSHGVGGQRPH